MYTAKCFLKKGVPLASTETDEAQRMQNDNPDPASKPH
jgi:hypothetical protein